MHRRAGVDRQPECAHPSPSLLERASASPNSSPRSSPARRRFLRRPHTHSQTSATNCCSYRPAWRCPTARPQAPVRLRPRRVLLGTDRIDRRVRRRSSLLPPRGDRRADASDRRFVVQQGVCRAWHLLGDRLRLATPVISTTASGGRAPRTGVPRPTDAHIRFHCSCAKIREWRLHQRIESSLSQLAETINSIVRGWVTYYGRFCRSRLYPSLRNINEYLVAPVRSQPVRSQPVERTLQRCRRQLDNTSLETKNG